MSADGFERATLSVRGESREFMLTRPSVHDVAILEELRYVRREAQAEADLAYRDWRQSSSSDGYTVYRAAQDRADAAQDALAACSTRASV